MEVLLSSTGLHFLKRHWFFLPFGLLIFFVLSCVFFFFSFFFFFFQSGLPMYPWMVWNVLCTPHRLALNLKRSVCLCLSSSGANGVNHHAQLVFFALGGDNLSWTKFSGELRLISNEEKIKFLIRNYNKPVALLPDSGSRVVIMAYRCGLFDLKSHVCMNMGYCCPELSYPVQLCTSIKGAFDALGISLFAVTGTYSHTHAHTYKQYINSIYLCAM